MSSEHPWVTQVRAALEREPRIDVHHNRIEVSMAGETLCLEGEVASIAAKRLAYRIAAGIAGHFEDHLRLIPAEPRDDGAIKDAVVRAFDSESAFRDCNIAVGWHEQHHVVRGTEGHNACSLNITIREGIVTLEGALFSPSHQRLAEALVWWSPGVRDVIDRVRIVPERADNDDEINDAVAMVLEKDPLVHSGQIHVTTHQGTVTLEGLVREEQERAMAENDAWFLTGVDQVVNRIEVRHGAPGVT